MNWFRVLRFTILALSIVAFYLHLPSPFGLDIGMEIIGLSVSVVAAFCVIALPRRGH